MKIVFVGKEWKYEDYLTFDIIKKTKPKEINFIDHMDIELHLNDNALFICNEKSYPLVAKILATLTNSSLSVKDNFLVPSIATFEKNSFILEYNNYLINVILVEKEIPKIFLPITSYEKINIFKFDKESAINFISPILNKYNIKYTSIYQYGFTTIYSDILDEKIKKEILEYIPFIVFGDLNYHIVKNLPPKKITFAESCTGGLIASSLTKVPSSSKCFDGSVVSYANRIKHEWLGVETSTLNKFGAVSEQSVKEMLLGAIEISKSDYAIAVSGIAGPDGGSKEKPVGTVYIGVANRKELKVELFHFKGDRNYIQYQSMMSAFKMFIEFSALYSKIS